MAKKIVKHSSSSQLMKGIARTPRNTKEVDLALATKLSEIRNEMLMTVLSSSSARQSLIQLTTLCLRNELDKGDFIVNIGNIKAQLNTDEMDQNSVEILENLIKELEAYDNDQSYEAKASLSKYRFAIKPFKFCADSIRVADYATSVQLQAQIAAFIAVRNEWITPHMRLVNLIAQSSERLATSLDLDDLTLWGFEGLVKAADRFEIDRGVQFGTYASNWIRQVISRKIMQTDQIVNQPVYVFENLNAISNLTRKYEQEHGRAPTFAEIKKETGLPDHKIYAATTSFKFSSIDEKNTANDGDSSSLSLGERLPDSDAVSIDDQIETHETYALLDALIKDTLDPKAQKVIRLRFGFVTGEEISARDVATSMRYTRERIRQISEEALDMLRARRRTSELKG